jgi:NAD(P)H-dependent FMN reductase
MVRFDVTVPSDVDATKNVVVSAYVVFDAPVGALIATTHLKDTLSKLGSLVFTTVASVNFKFDGTGNGAVDLLRGEL